MVGRTSVIGTVFIVSWVGVFAAVRAWFVPVRAATVSAAMLTVETVPPGADLLIDQQLQTTTPVTLALTPGVHDVVVRSGRAEQSARISLNGGAALTQYFDLSAAARQNARASSRLFIITDPAGASVVVDDRPRGISPLVIDDLVPGTHDVAVTSKSGSAHRTISVDNGSVKEVMFSLPSAAAPVGGWLTVTSPFPVEVVEGDDVVATSGAAKTMMAVGGHDVVVRNDAFGYEARKKINVVAGRVSTLEVVPPKAPLNVNANPWADVLIDGVSVGQTPLGNLMIAVGPHQVMFRHPQLGERQQNIVISANSVNRVTVDLTK